MARSQSVTGLRSEIMTSLHGRLVGIDKDHMMIHKDLRRPQDGWSSDGSTIVSTSMGTGSASLPNYGVSVVGATLASATTGYNLAAPSPGVSKDIVNPTTGQAVITTVAGSFFVTTGSVGSTYNQCTMLGKGVNLSLIGLTTALWFVKTPPGSTVSTNLAFV